MKSTEKLYERTELYQLIQPNQHSQAMQGYRRIANNGSKFLNMAIHN